MTIAVGGDGERRKMSDRRENWIHLHNTKHIFLVAIYRNVDVFLLNSTQAIAQAVKES